MLHILQNEHQFRPEAVKIAKEVLAIKQKAPKGEDDSKTIKEKVLSISDIDSKYVLYSVFSFQFITAVLLGPDFIKHIFSFPEITFINYLILIFWSSIHLITIISGVLILLKLIEGIDLLIIVSFVKLFLIEIGQFQFWNTDYLAFTILVGSKFGFVYEFGNPTNTLGILRSAVESPYIGINLISVFMLYWLFKIRKSMIERNEFKRLRK
ncbi:MAG: hypothetical protein JJ971_14245 [Balneolaceae bacterium]|nr:hypothetical protein [Balneolaceae bacterium]MBO6547562.1 hypothetical protein [Balneolaceae bacterium]